MKAHCLICLLLLSCGPFPRASALEPAGRRARYFYHVQRLDTISGAWRRYSATARISEKPGQLEIVIWNSWADPRINPLARITLARPPVRDTANGIWRYQGRIFRYANTGKDCYVESCTKLAITQNPDFTIREADRTARYRISRKEHRKP